MGASAIKLSLEIIMYLKGTTTFEVLHYTSS